MKEHVHTRSKGCASLFDVSHMGQIKFKDVLNKNNLFIIIDGLEKMQPNSWKNC